MWQSYRMSTRPLKRATTYELFDDAFRSIDYIRHDIVPPRQRVHRAGQGLPPRPGPLSRQRAALRPTRSETAVHVVAQFRSGVARRQ